MDEITIGNLKKFTTPLKAIKNSIPSVIFSRSKDTFHVNAKSEDGSKLVNLRFPSDVVKVEKSSDIEKLGLYNLDEYISIISMFDQDGVEITKEDNKLRIQFDEKSEVSYVLSDIAIIKDVEGPADPKNKIDFLITFELSANFFKKVKNISNTVNGKYLNMVMEDGVLSYTIGEGENHTNQYKEELLTECDCEDFDVVLPIKTNDKENFSFIVDSYPYKVSIHPKIIQLTAITDDYELLRYYLAPKKEDK